MQQPAPGKHGPVRFAGENNTLYRIRNVLESIELDCACRERLDTAFQRFAELEEFRARRHAHAVARHERLRIASILHLLEELEELPVTEPDESVFPELAGLFAEVIEAAHFGEAVLRGLSDDGS